MMCNMHKIRTGKFLFETQAFKMCKDIPSLCKDSVKRDRARLQSLRFQTLLETEKSLAPACGCILFRKLSQLSPLSHIPKPARRRNAARKGGGFLCRESGMSFVTRRVTPYPRISCAGGFFRARSARGTFQPLFLCAAKKKPLAVKRKRQRGISISPFGIPLKRPRRGL